MTFSGLLDVGPTLSRPHIGESADDCTSNDASTPTLTHMCSDTCSEAPVEAMALPPSAAEALAAAQLNACSDMITCIDAECGTILGVNAACYKMLGHKPAEMTGQHYYDFMDLAYHQKVSQVLESLEKQGATALVEFKRRHRGGSTVVVECSATLAPQECCDAFGCKRCVMCVERDVTERWMQMYGTALQRRASRQPEPCVETAQSAEGLLALLASRNCDFVYTVSLEPDDFEGDVPVGKVTAISPRTAAKLGLAEEDVIGRSDTDFIAEDQVVQVSEARAALFQSMRAAGGNAGAPNLRHTYSRTCSSGRVIAVEATYFGLFSPLLTTAAAAAAAAAPLLPALRGVLIMERDVSDALARDDELQQRRRCAAAPPPPLPLPRVRAWSAESLPLPPPQQHAPLQRHHSARRARAVTDSSTDSLVPWGVDACSRSEGGGASSDGGGGGSGVFPDGAHIRVKKKRSKAAARPRRKEAEADALVAAAAAGAAAAAARGEALPLRLPTRRRRFLMRSLGLSGDDVNAPNEGGSMPELRYPLVVAAAQNNAFRMSLLLALGADPNLIPPEVGFGALHMAVMSNSMDCLALLVAGGADLDIVAHLDADETATPLAIAAKEGYTDMVIALLELGADARCADQQGSTPLHYAVELDHAPIARALLRAGASVAAANTEGLTPAALVEMLGAAACADAVRDAARRVRGDSSTEDLMTSVHC